MPSSDAPRGIARGGLAGRRILIVGTGREGNAVAEEVLPVAASVVAYVDAEGPGVEQWRRRWTRQIPVLVGAEPPVDIDLVIASPGVSKNHPLLVRMRDAGIESTTGTSLWLGEHAAETIAVTGSKGKSTTSSLIAHLISVLQGPVELGGNIGIPLLDLEDGPRFVVELSSYQCAGLTVSPGTVVLTSLFPEHLDWHGSEAGYYADKLSIVAHGPRRVIVNALDPRLAGELSARFPGLAVERVGLPDGFHLADRGGEQWFAFGETALFPRSALPLRGDHNAVNACLALAALQAQGYDVAAHRDDVAQALGSFRALEHRLEEIPDASGLTFVDDSLSTSPYAAIEAMRAYSDSPLSLLVGGQDRGVDYAPLAGYLAEHPISAVIGLPGSGARILAELPQGQLAVVAIDMSDALAQARRLTPPSGVVLLSPAAPSYGRYNNYAERAADFRAAIAATAGG